MRWLSHTINKPFDQFILLLPLPVDFLQFIHSLSRMETIVTCTTTGVKCLLDLPSFWSLMYFHVQWALVNDQSTLVGVNWFRVSLALPGCSMSPCISHLHVHVDHGKHFLRNGCRLYQHRHLLTSHAITPSSYLLPADTLSPSEFIQGSILAIWTNRALLDASISREGTSNRRENALTCLYHFMWTRKNIASTVFHLTGWNDNNKLEELYESNLFSTATVLAFELTRYSVICHLRVFIFTVLRNSDACDKWKQTWGRPWSNERIVGWMGWFPSRIHTMTLEIVLSNRPACDLNILSHRSIWQMRRRGGQLSLQPEAKQQLVSAAVDSGEKGFIDASKATRVYLPAGL